MRWVLSGLVMSCSIQFAMALSFRSASFDVWRAIILEAIVVMCMSLALFLPDNMLEKQVEQYKRVD